MTIGLMIITHEAVGRALLDTATKIIGRCPVSAELLPVPMDSDCDGLLQRATEMIQKLDSGSGVIILTDMFGGTPSNIANHLAALDNVRIIAGVNLPMVVRVLNYSDLLLDEVAIKAYEGGREGIFICGRDR